MALRPLARLTKKLSLWNQQRHIKAVSRKIADSETMFEEGGFERAAHLAAECGEAGAPHLIGHVRGVLKDHSHHSPKVIEASLVALEKQLPLSLYALSDVAEICSDYRSPDKIGARRVRARAAEIIDIFGGMILLEDSDLQVPDVCRAIEKIMTIHDSNAHSAAIRLKVFGDLASLAIERHKVPVEQCSLQHLGDIEKIKRNLPAPEVEKCAAVVKNQIMTALQDMYGQADISLRIPGLA